MRIATYLNTTPQEVTQKQHNIWIGVSLGNKYFTKKHIEEYIKWSLLNTKQQVLIVIPDVLHSINLEVLDRRSPQRALQKAIRIGDSKEAEIKEIISQLSSDDQNKIKIIRWTNILKNKEYEHNLKIIKEEFLNNVEFHKFIVDIVKNGRPDRSVRLSKMSLEELNRLADYVLYELPSFVNGVQSTEDNIVYTLLPYPGLNSLDDLTIGLSNRTMFVGLADKLQLTNKIGILEAYVE